MFHKRLLNEFKDNGKYVAGMVVLQWMSLLANVVLMLVLSGYVSLILKQEVTAQKTIFLAMALIGAFLVRSLMGTLNSRMSFAASAAVKIRLRELIFQKLLRFGADYREAVATSEAVQVSTEGVDQLEIYFGKYVPQFFYSLLAPLTLFVIVGTMSMKVAVVLLFCVPLIPVSIVAVQKFAKKLLAKYWGTYTQLGDSFLENLQGLTTLKIYQADERYAKKMDEEAETFRKVTMRVLIMQLNSISIMDLVAYGGAALGMLLAILEFRQGSIALWECFFIILISAEFFLPLRLLGSFFHIAMNGNAAADKIFTFLDAKVPENGFIQEVPGSEISLEAAEFSYTEEKPVLRKISLQVEKNGFVALVGASGSGKSTIASLLMGEHRQYKGSITIGGKEVTDIAKEALTKKITRVRHDSYLFQGTVEENLLIGNPHATVCQMEDVLKQVDLYETIMEKGGLSMKIEEKAANLSGGQKQRLVLARAILHDSEIYIFDEATSNIDAESENKIMEVVQQLAAHKTILLISHRLANVEKADRIFVLRDGIIEEAGTHQQLMAQKGSYYQLYETQYQLEKYAREEQA